MAKRRWIYKRALEDEFLLEDRDSETITYEEKSDLKNMGNSRTFVNSINEW